MGSLQIPNKSAATGTRTRTGSDVLPQSGMCVVCLDGCPGYCEIGLSAMRGPETIYPIPFGKSTSSGTKDYPVPDDLEGLRHPAGIPAQDSPAIGQGQRTPQ